MHLASISWVNFGTRSLNCENSEMGYSVLWNTSAHKFPGDTYLLGDGGYPLLVYTTQLNSTFRAR